MTLLPPSGSYNILSSLAPCSPFPGMRILYQPRTFVLNLCAEDHEAAEYNGVVFTVCILLSSDPAAAITSCQSDSVSLGNFPALPAHWLTLHCIKDHSHTKCYESSLHVTSIQRHRLVQAEEFSTPCLPQLSAGGGR